MEATYQPPTLREAPRLYAGALKVDAQAIADGLYGIIQDQGQEAIVAFGMLPAELMAGLEKMLREKVIAISAAQAQLTVEELTPHVDQKLLAAIVQPIINDVGTGIYAAAKRAGKMIV